MSADSPITGQWPETEQQDSSKAYALSGRIMLTSIITLFIIVFFLVLLHLYARWYLTRLHRRTHTRGPNPRSTRFFYYANNNNNNNSNNNNTPLASGSTGLDPAVINTLPLFVYSSKTETEPNAKMLECAVCLSEFEDGETGRVLPNCKHRFHIGCIDMWFGSHSTCPLCRSPVEPVQKELTQIKEFGPVAGPVPGSSASLIETTSLGNRRKRVDVRIDVPVNELVTELPSQGFRSPGSRLLSFKRIMNMSRVSPSGVGPSCDSVATESDVELGRQEVDQE